MHAFKIWYIIDLICQEEDGDVSTFGVHVILPYADIVHGVPPGHIAYDDAGLGYDIEGDR